MILKGDLAVGELASVKVVKENGDIFAKAYFIFKDGIFSKDITEKETLYDMVEDYEIGITLLTSLVVVDYDKNFRFQTNSINQIVEAVYFFDDELKNYILNLLRNVYINDYDNYLSYVKDFEDAHYSKLLVNPLTDATPVQDLSEELNSSEFMDYVRESASICLRNGRVVEYYRDFGNEGEELPQSRGGANIIHDQVSDTFDASDFEVSDVETYFNDYHDYGCSEWDENTIIDIRNNKNYTGFHSIICYLKDIHLFTGILDCRMDFAGIKDSIRDLCKIKYKTHDELYNTEEFTDHTYIPIQKIYDISDKYWAKRRAINDELTQNIKKYGNFVESKLGDELPFN